MKFSFYYLVACLPISFEKKLSKLGKVIDTGTGVLEFPAHPEAVWVEIRSTHPQVDVLTLRFKKQFPDVQLLSLRPIKAGEGVTASRQLALLP